MPAGAALIGASLCVLSASLGGCVQVPERSVLRSGDGSISVPEDSCIVSAAAASPGLDPAALSLLSWNIKKGQDETWRRDLKRLSDSRTLLALQEAVVGPVDEVTALANRHWSHIEAFLQGNQAAGVLNAAPVKPIGECPERHAEPLAVVPKSFLASHYPLADGHDSLLVVNLHAINFTLGSRAFEAQLADAISHIESHRGPAILTGDFNTWSNRRQLVVDRLTASAQLDRVDFGDAQPRPILGRVLDHVYYRGLVVNAAEAIPVSSSDHDPLRVEFSLVREEKP
ncbi:MAG: endonuclease/exonuclease/phosphatase family protein [Pseudomonadota bacterium]